MVRRTRSLSVLVLSLLAAAGILIATPTAASAHDRLISSTPAAGATLLEVPADLTLTFNAELSADAGSAVIEIVSPAGVNIAAAAPVVSGMNVTQALPTDIEAGGYAVRWKVVSSDGHPISGEFTYGVDAAAIAPAPVETATPTAEPSAEPTATATPTPSATVEPEPVSSGAELVIGLTIAIVVVVGGGIAVLFVALARRRRTGAGTGARR